MTSVNDSAFPAFQSWPRPARVMVFIALALVALLIVGLLSAVHTVRRAFPETSGELQLPGLAAKVEVRRDANGIPQIYADSPSDLFFAQGFVQAQDRFYEMDFKRHLTSGRLSELLGSATLETDQFLRALNWRGVAQQEWPLLSQQTRANLTSFSDGVNAYLADHSTHEISLEYVVLSLGGLDYTPEKWTPIDSLAWLKAMAWDLRGNMQDEIDRARLSVSLQPEQVADLYPAYPFDRNEPILPGWDGPTSKAQTTGGDGIGSNSFVLSGDLTATGKPMLANDPHLSVSQPGIWYQMGLYCRVVTTACPYDVSGFTLAGVPGVVIGHNTKVGWGFTNLGPDVTDLYLEKLDGKRYLRGKKWRRLTERDETIKVRGEPSKTITVRSTDHGPLLSDVSRELSSVGANAQVPPGSPDRGNGYAVALQWTALTPGRTADAIFALNTAHDFDSFRDAARLFEVPSQNLVYADVAGNIGYQAPGRIPVRRPGHDGSVPVPGWDRAYDWTGKYIPFDDLPWTLNPDEGFIVTANQAVTGPSYPHLLTGDWDRGYRSQRIRDLLAADGQAGRFELSDLARIQSDTVNPMAESLTPLLLKVPLARPYYRQAQRLLKDWDGRQPADSAAAAYFNAVWRHLLLLTFRDQVGNRIEIGGGQRWMGVMQRLLQEPRNLWWDDADTTDQIEDRDAILRRAMHDARDELTRRMTPVARDWTWGHLHRMRLQNQSLGQSGIGLVERLFNRGPWEVGGGSAAVLATNWNAEEGYEVTTAPSMRMLLDFADLDRSQWINLTGASGHAFHRNYTDQTDLWAKDEYLQWPSTREAVMKQTRDLRVLEPHE